MSRIVLSAAVLALLLMSDSAFADDGWGFRLTPYIWLAGQKGDVATIPPLPPAQIDVSASEAVRNTDGGAMVMFDAKKGRHGFVVDFMYTDVQDDNQLLPPPISLNMRVISKTTIATAAYQYQLYGQDRTVVDVLAGIRYWDVDSELQFGGGLGVLAGRSISNGQSWVDPVLGIKGYAPFGSSRFYFEGGAGIGGFDVGSKRLWEINANVGYQWSKSIGTTIGYRMFDVDYENGDFLFDVRQEGWQLALTWAF